MLRDRVTVDLGGTEVEKAHARASSGNGYALTPDADLGPNVRVLGFAPSPLRVTARTQVRRVEERDHVGGAHGAVYSRREDCYPTGARRGISPHAVPQERVARGERRAEGVPDVKGKENLAREDRVERQEPGSNDVETIDRVPPRALGHGHRSPFGAWRLEIADVGGFRVRSLRIRDATDEDR